MWHATVIHPALTFIRCRALLLLLLAVPGLVLADINDSFANRIEIFNSVPVNGSNVGATLEAGEPIPAGYTSSNYQATLWYVFNPQPGTGNDSWHEINTVGSAIDTVLTVWSGTSLDTLQLIHVNNEAIEGKVSRIRFKGSPGNSYFISVAGANAAARGAVSLILESAGNVEMVNNGLAGIFSTGISPASVDVSTATASTTFTIEMYVTTDIASGYVRAYAPSGQQVASSPLTIANRTSGANLDGIYAVPLTLPRYLAPGTYRLAFEVQAANSVKSDSFGWEQMSSLGGFTQTFTVLNSGAVDTYGQFNYAYGFSGANAAQTADSDGDGIRNLAEFAFGTDPTTTNAGPLVVTGATLTKTGLPHIYLTGTGTQQRLRVEFIERVSDPALTYLVEFSDDLIHWTTSNTAPQVMATSGGYQAVFVEDQTFLPVKKYRFGHVRVNYQLPP